MGGKASAAGGNCVRSSALDKVGDGDAPAPKDASPVTSGLCGWVGSDG
jgi:hypothetical protein